MPAAAIVLMGLGFVFLAMAAWRQRRVGGADARSRAWWRVGLVFCGVGGWLWWRG